MGLLSKKEAYVTKGMRLIEEKRTPEATIVVVDGLNDYQNRIIKALNRHPVADTALVVVALRNLADSLEEQEPSCKGLVTGLIRRLRSQSFKTARGLKKRENDRKG